MHARLLMAVFLLCCSPSILAQTAGDSPGTAPPVQTAPQTKPPAPPPATAVITGTVFCGDTHRPARGAVVMAQPMPKSGRVEPNISASTSRVSMDGTYTVSHLHPGDYSIIALLPGYISPFDDLEVNQIGDNDSDMRDRLARNGVISVRNNETAHQDVTLERGASIGGRVTYDDGAPATQIILNLEDVNAKPRAQKSVSPGSDELDMQGVNAGVLVRGIFLHQNQGTDDQGNFRIAGIKPGTYRLAATLSATAELSGGDDGIGLLFGGFPNSRALRIYSGDTFHKSAAKTYELRAGDEITGVDITIPVYAFHRIEGHVATLEGQPVMSAGITLTDSSDDSFVLHARLARDGAFVFSEVPSGAYKLAVTDAKSATVPEGNPDTLPDLAQLPASMLQNVQTFADKTTTVLVKDADITDLSIQLPNATPATQPIATPTAPSQ